MSCSVGSDPKNDVTVDDDTVSRFHLELRRSEARVEVRDLHSTNGTSVGQALLYDTSVLVEPGAEVQLGQTRIGIGDGKLVFVDPPRTSSSSILGNSAAIQELLVNVDRVAGLDVPVVIQGESGTGKELVAQALHDGSPRRNGPFVTVDCGALTPTLASSELLGHVAGAFTGAVRKHAGAFERANGGTLFLDELGELPVETQATLLGVLERRRLQRVGDTRSIAVDVRVVSATHRDLRKGVNDGSFRLDLFYRLGVVLLALPPLRERLEDIPVLADHFLREAGVDAKFAQVFSPKDAERMRKYSWPGNVRELRNAVLGTFALGSPPSWSSGGDEKGDPIETVLGLPYRDAKRDLLNRFEQRYLNDLLDRTDGNVRKAARYANMNRSYLIELLERHGLRRRFRD